MEILCKTLSARGVARRWPALQKGFGSPLNDLGDPSSAMTKRPDAAHPCLLGGSARWLALSCFG